MLELLLLAFFSAYQSGDVLSRPEGRMPDIGVISPAPSPEKDPRFIAPDLFEEKETAVLAVDATSGKVMFQKDSLRAQPIASLTKIMTYLIIREHHDLDEVVTIPQEATQAGGAKAELYAFEKLDVRTMLQALLIPSGNDAAVALALFHSGTQEAFVQEMNSKAQKLGLASATFYNPTGLDMREENGDTYQSNTMSAYDLALLTRIALRDDFFRETVAQKTFSGTSVDGEFYHEKASTNQLLDGYLPVKGVKTGYEISAGECLIALMESPQGYEVLTVVLGSRDRFGESKKLLSWIADSFVWR